MQQPEHRDERQRALGDPHRKQPAVVARPLQIEPPAEVEDDQSQRELGQHARLRERGVAQQAEDAGPEQETGRDVAGDRRQHARRRREASTREAGEQQQPEDQERVRRGGPGGQEVGRTHAADIGGCSVGLRRPTLAAHVIGNVDRYPPPRRAAPAPACGAGRATPTEVSSRRTARRASCPASRGPRGRPRAT